MPLRAALLALLVALVLARPASADELKLRAALDQAVAGAPGSVGIVLIDLDSGYTYAHDANTRFEAASLFKLYVMAAAYERAHREPAFLSAPLEVSRPNVQSGAVMYAMTVQTVATAIADMIEWSDNEATAALVDLIGIDEINDSIAALGLHDSVVRSSAPSGNTTTPSNVASFFRSLARRELVSPEASDAMMWLLVHQDINDRLPRGVPDGTLIAHKTGNSAGTYHDAGIMWTPYGQRVVVVLTARLDGIAARGLIEEIAFWSYSLPAVCSD
jgi:beta-lactamase class A